MSARLTPLQSRLAAIVLLLLALAALAAAIAIPTWRLHRHYDEAIEDFSDKQHRFANVGALRGQIDAAIGEVEARKGRQYYIKGGSQALVAAELQGLIGKIIEDNKGRVISSQIQASKDEPKPKESGKDTKAHPAKDSAKEPLKVSISVQLNAATVPLQSILHTIETHEPYLFIDMLTVRANQGRGYRPIPGVQPEFSVQLTVSAFSLLEEAAKPGPPKTDAAGTPPAPPVAAAATSASTPAPVPVLTPVITPVVTPVVTHPITPVKTPAQKPTVGGAGVKP